MGFNLNELEKIKRKTSGSDRTKKLIAEKIIEVTPLVEKFKLLEGEERHKALSSLSSKFSSQRRAALQSGVASYSDPNWATPAVIESWLQGLIFDNEEEISRIEYIVEELRNPNRHEESSGRMKWLGPLIMIAGSMIAYMQIGLWAAILAFVTGAIISGWKYRYDVPLKTSN